MKAPIFKIGLSVIIFAAFVWWPVLNQPALAADIESIRLQLNRSIDRLSEIRDDPKISEAERLTKELEIRKEIIQKAIDLSLFEIQGLKIRLENLAIEEDQKEDYLFKTDSLAYLQKVEGYLNEIKERMAAINRLDDIKGLASELREYRETVYKNRAQNITNFLLGFQINELITSAENRRQRIQNDLRRLERARLIRAEEFSVLINQAQRHINEAVRLNQRARQIIIGNGKQQTTEQEEEAKIAITDNDIERNSEARKLIESSLANLRASHEIFIKISREVRKTLRF